MQHLKKSKRGSVKWLGVIVSLVMCVGCVASHQSIVADVSVERWGESRSFEIGNNDTTTLCDLEIFLRYYPSQVREVIRVAVDTTTPDSMTLREIVNIPLDVSTRPRGESRIERFKYRSNILWSQQGSYSVVLTPIFSCEGIEAVGVNRVKSKGTSNNSSKYF